MDDSSKSACALPVHSWKEDEPDNSSRFPVFQYGRTVAWLAEHYLPDPGRVWFWIKSTDGDTLGMVALSGLDSSTGQAEIDQMVRGVPDQVPGLMYASVQTLLAWTFQKSGASSIRRVARDNVRALRLFDRCGFRGPSRIVEKGKRGAGTKTETKKGKSDCTEIEIELELVLTRSEWMAAHRLEKAA